MGITHPGDWDYFSASEKVIHNLGIHRTLDQSIRAILASRDGFKDDDVRHGITIASIVLRNMMERDT